MQDSHTFRLFVLGRVDDPRPLTTLAEFHSQRAVQRVDFAAVLIESLARQISELRSYIEGRSAAYQRQALETLGSAMFELVIQRAVHQLLHRARGATDPNKLPFELIVEDPVILAWPWEYMFDRNSETFICQDFHPISRTVLTPERSTSLNRSPDKLRVLVVVAVPPDDPHTAPEEQVRSIDNAFATYLAGRSGSVHVDVQGIADPDDLRRLLQKSAYDVLHFFGHAGADASGGFLVLERRVQGRIERRELPAKSFAQMLINRPTRLVFLNACETALGTQEDTARNSVAVELMRYGLSAVIATQFKMPANRAHRFASLVYGAIANGLPLYEAMFDGRSTMEDKQNGGRFVDWGIPVLYAMDPHSVLYQAPAGRSEEQQSQRTTSITASAAVVEQEPVGASSYGGGPATQEGSERAWSNDPLAAIGAQGAEVPSFTTARKRIAVLDADANVARLPELVARANEVQSYFHFVIHPYDLLPGDVVSGRAALKEMPAPAGIGVKPKLNPAEPITGPQLYVPRVARRLAGAPEAYDADYVCCLTSHRVATMDYDGTIVPDVFITLVDTEDLVGSGARYCVAAVSVYGLRRYAVQTNVSMAKATFFLCLAAVLDLANEDIEFHEETRGCPLDTCLNPADITVSLKRMKFDDPACIAIVNDPDQVQAINQLLAIPDDFAIVEEPPVDPTADPELDAGIVVSAREAELNGVDARTGRYTVVPVKVLASRARTGQVTPDLEEVRHIVEERSRTFLDVRAGVEPEKIGEAGWGVVFPASVDPTAIRAQLQPLLSARQLEANETKKLYREYSGSAGYQPGESKIEWLQRNGAGPGLVNPDAVPYYLLLVGSPEEIPFGFQHDLSVQYAVGRLCFDELSQYGNYANAALAASRRPSHSKAVFFGTRNPGDKATRLSATQLVAPLAEMFAARNPTWTVESRVGREATKARLMEVMDPLDPPSLVFTATHGTVFPFDDPLQETCQGAFLCQEWNPQDGQHAVPADHYFAADDVKEDSKLAGAVIFNFACYSAGTPRTDDLPTLSGKPEDPVAKRAFVAELPKRLLGLKEGPLAVIGHVDRAWGYSFLWPGVDDHRIPFEDALLSIAAGCPIGHAMRGFPQRFADLAVTLDRVSKAARDGEPDVKLAGWWTACRDARNYVILGDPAGRLNAH